MTWTEIKPCPQYPQGGMESVFRDGKGILVATITRIDANCGRMSFHYEDDRHRAGAPDGLAIAGGEREYRMPISHLCSIAPKLILADIKGVEATSLDPSPWRHLRMRLQPLLDPPAEKPASQNLSADDVKRLFPAGTRIRLVHMDDIQAVPDGTTGTVNYVDSMGQMHMKWDNGRGLAVVPSQDEFERLVFHVTTAAAMDSIRKDGLKPTVGPRSKKLNENPGIFLFPDRNSVEDAAMNWLGDEFDDDEPLLLLTVALPAVFPVDVSPSEVVSRQPISPACIVKEEPLHL